MVLLLFKLNLAAVEFELRIYETITRKSIKKEVGFNKTTTVVQV